MSIRQSIVAGYGIYTEYADNPEALIEGLIHHKQVKRQHYIKNVHNHDLELLRLTRNPDFVPFPKQPMAKVRTLRMEFILDLLERVIEQALNRANMDKKYLQGKKVRVYLTGHGLRTNLIDTVLYNIRNDEEDLLLYPNIKENSSKNYAQDKLATKLAEQYHLSWLPITVYSASCSSLSAIHMANNLIEKGIADICLLIGWTDTLLQDLLFLGSQNLLSTGKEQPFSLEEHGILPANVATAFLLENRQHAEQRGMKPRYWLHHTSSQQSSGGRGSTSFSADFRFVANIIKDVLNKSDLQPNDIGCVFPHANGVYASDKSEIQAIQKIWGNNTVPIVSYKGQIGYMSTNSTIVDLIIAIKTLAQSRIIPFITKHKLSSTIPLNFINDCSPIELKTPHIMKITLGMEGSVIACMLSRLDN